MNRYLNPVTGHGPYHQEESPPPPPIFLITTDMVPCEFFKQSPQAPRMRTPHLDRLAREGVTFSSTSAASPLCSPSRASYLTGRYSYITTNGERSHDGHEIHLREGDIIFPEYLKASGYAVKHVGKSHVGTHKFLDVFGENDSPWNRWSPPWFDDDEYRRFLAAKGLGHLEFGETIHGEDPSGKGKGAFYGGWIAPQNGQGFPQEATYPHFLVDKAITAAQGAGDNPLYLQLDFFGPHQPFAIPGGWEERRKELEGELLIPESFQNLQKNDFKNPGNQPRIYDLYRKNWGIRDKEVLQKYLIANILQYEVIDAALGRLWDYLDSAGLYQKAWIFYISDHGEMNGREGLVDKGAYLNPRVVRVPFLIKPPAQEEIQPGQVLEQPVSLLDLAPTILSLTGIQTPEKQDGINLLPQLYGSKESRPEDKPILSEIWSHVMPNPAVSLQFLGPEGRQYMYTYNACDPQDELYLVQESLVKLNNLAAHPPCRGILLRGRFLLEQALSRDPRWRGYLNFMRLEYAESFSHREFDRQHFLGKISETAET